MSHDHIPDSPEPIERLLRAIYASASWRITAPLRWLSKRFNSLKRMRRYLPAARPNGAPTADTPQIASVRADAPPARWPGVAAPQETLREQLDAAMQRRAAEVKR